MAFFVRVWEDKSTITQFRRRTDRYEALQITKLNYLSIAKWCEGRIEPEPSSENLFILIDTTRRLDFGTFGDWVIKDCAGMYSILPDDIFRKMFKEYR